MTPSFAGFAAWFAAATALSLPVTKGTDFVRNLVDKEDNMPKWLWNVVPLVLALGLTLGWQLDLTPTLFKLVPALANSRLTGVAGQVITAFALWGLSSGGHEVLDWISGAATRAHAAGSPTP